MLKATENKVDLCAMHCGTSLFEQPIFLVIGLFHTRGRTNHLDRQAALSLSYWWQSNLVMCPNWRVSAPSHLHHCFVEVGRGGRWWGFPFIVPFYSGQDCNLGPPLASNNFQLCQNGTFWVIHFWSHFFSIRYISSCRNFGWLSAEAQIPRRHWQWWGTWENQTDVGKSSVSSASCHTTVC